MITLKKARGIKSGGIRSANSETMPASKQASIDFAGRYTPFPKFGPMAASYRHGVRTTECLKNL